MSEPAILRSDLDYEDDRLQIMRFRLFYEGPLGSQSRRLEDHQYDNKADHKHDVRLEFSHQIAHLWRTMPSLAAWESYGEVFGASHARKPMRQVIEANQPDLAGKRFVPLVNAEFGLLCKLDVLLLRRDKPGGILISRDIDNRLKIIFDALSAPQSINQLGPKGIADIENSSIDVLVKDDSLITHVSVETDELLGPPSGADDSFSRVIVTVDLSIYRAIMVNMGVF